MNELIVLKIFLDKLVIGKFKYCSNIVSPSILNAHKKFIS